MNYNNKLITELISILDKRTAIAKSELNEALEYVKTYDVSITDYIKSDQQRQTDDYTGKINELTENTNDSFELIRNEIDRKLRENNERINDINVHIERNIGKFFYNTFLKNKFKSNTVEFSKNSLFFIFFGKDNSNSEVTAIRKCIDIERHNISKMVDNFQILKNGCLNLQYQQDSSC